MAPRYLGPRKYTDKTLEAVLRTALRPVSRTTIAIQLSARYSSTLYTAITLELDFWKAPRNGRETE